jgi:hypothetical protein
VTTSGAGPLRLGAAAGLSSPAPLRAPAFEVAGEDGRVRARPGRATDGSLALNLADTDGLVRATLVVEPGA